MSQTNCSLQIDSFVLTNITTYSCIHLFIWMIQLTQTSSVRVQSKEFCTHTEFCTIELELIIKIYYSENSENSDHCAGLPPKCFCIVSALVYFWLMSFSFRMSIKFLIPALTESLPYAFGSSSLFSFGFDDS